MPGVEKLLVAILGIIVWTSGSLCQSNDRNSVNKSGSMDSDGCSHQVMGGWHEEIPALTVDDPEDIEPVLLSSIYERFIESLDQSDDIKQRYRTFLVDALSEPERARVIDQEYRSRVEAYLEIERGRFDLSWYRKRAEIFRDAPLNDHLELGKREAWILAPHLCLTLRNAIFCDPSHRADMDPDAQSELLAAMAVQADFAKALLDQSFAHDVFREPIRDALLETALAQSRQDALQTIELVMTHPFFAPARRALDATQLIRIRNSVFHALADIFSDAEKTAVERVNRSLQRQNNPVFQRQIEAEGVDYRNISESQTETILKRLRAMPPQPTYDDWVGVLDTLPLAERMHSRYQYEIARESVRRITVEILRQMLGGDVGFNPAGDTEFCLPAVPRPTQYELVYAGVSAQVLLVDPRFKTLQDIEYEPAFDDHVPDLQTPFRPNTKR